MRPETLDLLWLPRPHLDGRMFHQYALTGSRTADALIGRELAQANRVDGDPGAVGRVLDAQTQLDFSGTDAKPRPSIRRKHTLLSFCQGT